MVTVSEILQKHPLVLIKLGAGGDDYRFVPESIRKHTILVCLDATGSPRDAGDFRQTILIKQVVSDSPTPRTFIERAWWGCSSLLEAKQDLVRKYAVETHYAEKTRMPVDNPVTVTQILAANHLAGFDALLTDLEGMDLPVIRSCGALLEGASIVQSELRFEPFYEGEPNFHEASAYLHERGFALLDMRLEHWKPVSRNWSAYSDGITVFADCLFYRAPQEQALKSASADERALVLTKSVILLSLFGKKSLAAWLLERHESLLDSNLRDELAVFAAPDGARRHFAREFLFLARRVKRLLVKNRFAQIVSH